QGTQTDFDGNFSIEVAPGSVLEFSYMGFTTVTQTVGAQNQINVVMSQDVAQLNEVIVVGYGTTTEQSFTGTAAVIDGEELAEKNVSSATQALEGEVAGVQVINTSGQPGSEPEIRILC